MLEIAEAGPITAVMYFALCLVLLARGAWEMHWKSAALLTSSMSGFLLYSVLSGAVGILFVDPVTGRYVPVVMLSLSFGLFLTPIAVYFAVRESLPGARELLPAGRLALSGAILAGLALIYHVYGAGLEGMVILGPYCLLFLPAGYFSLQSSLSLSDEVYIRDKPLPPERLRLLLKRFLWISMVPGVIWVAFSVRVIWQASQ